MNSRVLRYRKDSGMAMYVALMISAIFGFALLAFLNLVNWNYKSTMR